MADRFGPKRPLGITIVAALAIVAAVFDIIGGIVVLTAQDDQAVVDALGSTGMVVTVGIASLLFGIAMLVIAFGLLQGNPVSRIAATIVQALSLVMSIWLAVVQPSSLGTEIPSALLAVAILILLWTPDATRFFHGLAPDEPVS